ncbi:MAG: hypothetical protein WB676_01775, partial [Bryobacteraceae bacterium]
VVQTHAPRSYSDETAVTNYSSEETVSSYELAASSDLLFPNMAQKIGIRSAALGTPRRVAWLRASGTWAWIWLYNGIPAC